MSITGGGAMAWLIGAATVRQWGWMVAVPYPRGRDPGILTDLSDKSVNKRPSRWLGIGGGEMRLGQHRPQGLCCLTGINEIIDDQPAFAVSGFRRGLDHIKFALFLAVIRRNTGGFDQPDLKFACHHSSWEQARHG